MSKSYTVTFDDNMAATIDRCIAEMRASNPRIASDEAAMNALVLSGVIELLQYKYSCAPQEARA